MPTVKFKVDLPGSGALAVEHPGEVLAGQTVPAQLMPASGLRVCPAAESLFMWKQAAQGVAFVGVINMLSAKIHLRPLAPREVLDPTAPGGQRPDSIAYQSTWTVAMGQNQLKPIVHNAGGQTSHNQLRDHAVVADGVKAADKESFAGFAITKAGGTIGSPHVLALRSGTLNKKFKTHGGANALSGYTLPTDWAELIRSTLERHLPD
ncbi:MAG TPA: hypothetical protein VGM67_12840 [Gemmatimonadaceae bacterium]